MAYIPEPVNCIHLQNWNGGCYGSSGCGDCCANGVVKTSFASVVEIARHQTHLRFRYNAPMMRRHRVSRLRITGRQNLRLKAKG